MLLKNEAARYSPLNNETLMNGNLRLRTCELSLISKRSSSALPEYCGTLSARGLRPEPPGEVLLDFALEKALVKTLPCSKIFGSVPPRDLRLDHAWSRWYFRWGSP